MINLCHCLSLINSDRLFFFSILIHLQINLTHFAICENSFIQHEPNSIRLNICCWLRRKRFCISLPNYFNELKNKFRNLRTQPFEKSTITWGIFNKSMILKININKHDRSESIG